MSRSVDAADIEDLAIGAAVLGAGGGGDPHVGTLMAKQAIEDNGPVDMVTPAEVPSDGLVIPAALMGAPTVAIEKIPEGTEPIRSIRRLAREFDAELYGTMPIECGGINSTIPFLVAAREGIPLVDADGMGRAFPELHHETFNVYGVDGTPAVVSDEKANLSLFETRDNRTLESFARAITIEMGGVSFLCDYPMTGREVQETAIRETISLGMEIGDAIRDPPADSDPIAALKEVTAASNYGRAIELFRGKVTDVERRTQEGFSVGTVTLAGLEGDADSEMTIQFQNENLIAHVDGAAVATVPDLITVLDTETGMPVTTESIQYGYRVRVLGIPTPEIMRSEAAIDIWGPEYFGYDLEYLELERRYPEYYRRHGVPDGKEHLLDAE